MQSALDKCNQGSNNHRPILLSSQPCACAGLQMGDRPRSARAGTYTPSGQPRALCLSPLYWVLQEAPCIRAVGRCWVN